MIKQINPQNLLTTPFVANKTWELSNTNPQDLLLVTSGSVDYTLALEFTDYSTDDPFQNISCSIALENQTNDRLIYEEGITGSGGPFFPDSEPTNFDGTYKRLVHAQVKRAFYNNYKNPIKIFGVEYIDFALSNTYRNITDSIRVYTIPQLIFGERIVPYTVNFKDDALDDNVEIVDDGYQNLIAKTNLFAKVQEVRTFGNIIIPGTSSFKCYPLDVEDAVPDYGRLSVGFFGGSMNAAPPFTEDVPQIVGFYTGSVQLGVITSSLADSGSAAVAFYTGSVSNQVVTGSAFDSGSIAPVFYTGSIFNQVVTGSFTQTDSGSLGLMFATGSMYTQVITSSRLIGSGSVNIGFHSGNLT